MNRCSQQEISEIVIDLARHAAFGGFYCCFSESHGTAAFKDIAGEVCAVFQMIDECFKFKSDVVSNADTRDFGKGKFFGCGVYAFFCDLHKFFIGNKITE